MRSLPPRSTTLLTTVVLTVILLNSSRRHTTHAKLPDRSRVVQQRQATGRVTGLYDNGRPLEGPLYRTKIGDIEQQLNRGSSASTTTTAVTESDNSHLRRAAEQPQPQQQSQQQAPWQTAWSSLQDESSREEEHRTHQPNDQRHLSSQLSGCCYNYQKYSASDLCYMYGNDCQSGSTKSHDSGDASCSQDGLSFIGVSFSVNTANGNPYSYQLNDQFPMENIIDRDYKYIMSMDEDGWLVGGGYKTFDYSGKMP